MNLLRVLFLSILFGISSFAQTQTEVATAFPNAGSVIHVRTALSHVSLLEFKEPVTAAAAGSKNFHIERFENKVLITPIKAGISTNLFVWTATQRFSYELDPPSETPGVSLAIDAPAPEVKPTADPEQRHTRVVTQALLDNTAGLRQIDSTRIRFHKDDVVVRVDHVVQSSETLFIYFTVNNGTKQPLRLVQPTIFRLEPAHSPISLFSFLNCQIDQKVIPRLGSTKYVPMPISNAEFQPGDVSAGMQKAGVIAVHLSPTTPTVLQLVVSENLRATFVL